RGLRFGQLRKKRFCSLHRASTSKSIRARASLLIHRALAQHTSPFGWLFVIDTLVQFKYTLRNPFRLKWRFWLGEEDSGESDREPSKPSPGAGQRTHHFAALSNSRAQARQVF